MLLMKKGLQQSKNTPMMTPTVMVAWMVMMNMAKAMGKTRHYLVLLHKTVTDLLGSCLDRNRSANLGASSLNFLQEFCLLPVHLHPLHHHWLDPSQQAAAVEPELHISSQLGGGLATNMDVLLSLPVCLPVCLG